MAIFFRKNTCYHWYATGLVTVFMLWYVLSLDITSRNHFQISVVGMAYPQSRALVNGRSVGPFGSLSANNQRKANVNMKESSGRTEFGFRNSLSSRIARGGFSFKSRSQDRMYSKAHDLMPLRMSLPSEAESESVESIDFGAAAVLEEETSEEYSNLEELTKGAVVRRLEDVKKPEIDVRNYRHIWLENGLQVLLVNDPEADVASASLNIHAGHFQDPEDFPGLAHFHEHMLFLGTKKFPDESEYEEYLTSHGGYSNAYTAMEDTNVYFEVDSEHLEGALERFSSFFTCPLFTESATDRELNAVDSENTNNLQEDTWRLYQLQKSTSDHRHPFHKFSTGNNGTLRKDGLRQALLDFNEKYYSAPLMKLVILGEDDLDTLEQWAVKYFSDVRTSDISPKYKYDAPPFGPEQLGKRLLAVPIKETRRLALAFPLPLTDTPENGLYAKPTVYLGQLIGHEGPGSLHAYLNQKGWITGLSAGTGIRTDDFSMFKVSLSLTDEGMENVEEIIDTIFEFLAMMKNQGPQKWVFDELQTMSEVSFRFKEWGDASSFTQKYAEVLTTNYPPEDILYGTHHYQDWRPDLIEDFMNRLHPDNCQIQITSSTFKDQAGGWEKEKWYGTQYQMVPFTEEERTRWGEAQGTIPSLKLATPNEFIPSDFDLKCDQPEQLASSQHLSAEEARDLPPAVVREPVSPVTGKYDAFRVWHKMDTTFRVPKASLIMRLLCGREGYYSSPLAMSLARLYVKMVKEELKEYAYDATCAGLRYGINAEPEGLQLTVSGYSDKLPVLADKVAQTLRVVLDKCRSITTEPKNAEEEKMNLLACRFFIIIMFQRDDFMNIQFRNSNSRYVSFVILALFQKHKQTLLKDYANFDKETPYQRAMYYARMVLEADAWHISEYSQSLENPITTPATMVRVIENILGRTQVEALAHGNVVADEALHLANAMKEGLKMPSLPLPDSELQDWRRVAIPQGREVKVQMEMSNPDEENSAIEVHYQVGVFDGSYRKDCLLDLINHIAYNSAFKALRTEEQLGYIVSTLVRKSGWPARVGGFSVIVQGPHHPPTYLDERVEAWLTRFRAELQAMSEEDFAQNVQGLISQKLEKYTRLGEETAMLWSEISAKDHTDFHRYKKEAEILKEIPKQEVLEFFDRYISQTTDIRRKLSVQIYSAKMKDQMLTTQTSGDESTDDGSIRLHDLTSIRQFKQSSYLYGTHAL